MIPVAISKGMQGPDGSGVNVGQEHLSDVFAEGPFNDLIPVVGETVEIQMGMCVNIHPEALETGYKSIKKRGTFAGSPFFENKPSVKRHHEPA